MTRTHPAHALEQQAELIDRAQKPLYKAYCTFFLAAKKRTAAAGRVVARPEDGNGPLLPADREFARGFLDWQLAALRAAQTFHVAEEMTPLIGWMAGKLREEDHLTRECLPGDVGFTWFDTPLTLQDVQSKKVGVRAVLWQHGVEGELAGVRLVHYSDPWLPDDVDASLSPEERFNVHKLGRLVVDHVEFIPYGMGLGPGNMAPVIRQQQSDNLDDWGTTVVTNHRRLLLAYFLLLGQKIVKSETESARAGSSFRKRRRMNIPDRVQVVTLRETVYPRHEGGGNAEVEWQHRWPVKRHPHLYWTGPGRKIPRVVWVEAYLKGPAGAPIVVTEKVHTLKH
jgi:hypothetical protein